MKITTIILLITFATVISCKKDDSNGSTKTIASKPLADILLTATATSSSIILSWEPVDGCSWYNIASAVQGNTLVGIANYQDNQSNPITYTISNLSPNTVYVVKLEGSDYLNGGKVLATKSITVTTPQ